VKRSLLVSEIVTANPIRPNSLAKFCDGMLHRCWRTL
jgi:hypothetical protein